MRSPSSQSRRPNLQHTIVDGRKPCGLCKQRKPIGEFHKDKSAPVGYSYNCAPCCSTLGKRSHAKHKDKRHATARRWKEQNPEQVRDRYFRYTYGITATEFDSMLEAQDGRCAICRKREGMLLRKSTAVRRMCVDHDHETGAIRGVLCALCNTGIGALKHDVGLLQQAIEYLSHQMDASTKTA